MSNKSISSIFLEGTWKNMVPPQYIIPSLTFAINKQDIDFLTDDDTNPSQTDFSLYQTLKQGIAALSGKVYAKFANRAPKDISQLDRKVTSVRDLIMLVKMSEFLTEGLCEEEEGADILLRRYDELFEKELDEFRAYSIGGCLVGICQKNPSYVAGAMTENQISKIAQLHALICDSVVKLEGTQEKVSFVFDLYCSPNGNAAYLFSIEPFHIHGLSLFTEQELAKHSEKKTQRPIIRMVEKQSQLKAMDLSGYSSRAEFKDPENVKKWMEFMEGKESQD